MKISLFTLLAFFLSTAFSPTVTAETINPQTYHSIDKKYSLLVDPSSRDGIGSAKYTYSENNVVIWTNTLDQTFVDVRISSAGDVFAYSYSLGVEGDKYPESKDQPHHLSLWMLNKLGETVFKQDHERGVMMQAMHQNEKPLCEGIVLQEHTDTVSFRLSPNTQNIEKLEQWHQYSATTGAKKPDLLIDFVQQKNYDGGSIETVLTIPNTDYILLELRQHVSEESAASSHTNFGFLSDSLFYLMHSAGEVVWSDVNLGDLRFEYNTKAGKQWDRYLDHHALINFDASSNQFSIQHLKDQEVIFFEIDDKLQVNEKSRKPLKPFTQTEPKVSLDLQPPKFLYTIELEKAADKPKLPSRFSAFAINKKYEFGSLVKENGNLYFYLISSAGHILKQIPIKIDPKGFKITSVVAKNDSTWLFLMGNFKEDSRLFEINTESEQYIEIPIDAPGGGRMVVHDNEDITILASENGDYLRHFNKQGKTLWTFHEEDYDEPGYLLSPVDVALSNDDQIVVHDHMRGQLNFYSSDGQFIKTIDFKNTTRGELNYAGFLLVINDVIYVEDHDDSTVIHSYSLEGKWLAEYSLEQKSGKKINYIGDMKADVAGNIWVSEGGLYQFNAEFKNSKYVGQAEQQQMFNGISTIQTNSKGDIYLFNENNFSVIQMSATGEKKNVFSVPVDQIPTSSFSTVGMFIGQQDQVYVNLDQCKYVVFNAEGEYLKEFKSALKCGEYDHIDLTVHHNENTFWKVENDTITLESYQGNEFHVLKTITKDSDGYWLNRVGDLVTDKKGRLVLTGDRSDNFKEVKQVIYVFDEHGKAISTFSIKDYVSTIVLADDYIYLNYVEEELIRVLDLKGQQVASFMNKNVKQESCHTTKLFADEVNKKLYVYGGKSISVFELL